MQPESSVIRQKALLIFHKVDTLALRHIQHKSLAYLYHRFVKPHLEGLILYKIPEPELKTAITEAFYEIKPVVEEFQLAHDFKEAEKFNTPKMTELLKKMPDFKNLEDLLDGV